jgi:hypothetical protein
LRAEEYPQWVFVKRGTTGWVNRRLAEQFRRHGRFTASASERLRGTVIYGFYPRDGKTFAVAWVEVNPKRTGERQAIRQQAEVGNLGVTWERPLDGTRWQILAKEVRAINLDSEEAAVDWFVACHDQLRDAGILDLIPRLGTVPPEEVDPEIVEDEDAEDEEGEGDTNETA